MNDMKPKFFVAWTLAVGFALFLGLAGMALVHDVWISDFPRLRALLSVDGQLMEMAIVVGIAATPATLLVFMFGGPRSNIEFSVMGIKVKGVAAAPVLWTLVFLATAAVLTVGLRVAGQW